MYINKLYFEDVCLYEILKNSEKLKDNMEFILNDESADDENKSIYKKKLTNIYRIRNNAFAVLLKNKYKCTREEDSLILNINGEKFACNEHAIKTVLQKEYDEVLNESLITEQFIEEKHDCDSIKFENKKEEEVKTKEVEKETVVEKEFEEIKTIVNIKEEKHEDVYIPDETISQKTEEKIEEHTKELKNEETEDIEQHEETDLFDMFNDDFNNEVPETIVEENVVYPPVVENIETIEESPVIVEKSEEKKIEENNVPYVEMVIEEKAEEEPEKEQTIIKEEDVESEKSIEEQIAELRKNAKTEEFIEQDNPVFARKSFDNNDGTLLSIAYDSIEQFSNQEFTKLIVPEEDDLVKKYDELIFDIYKIKVKDFEEEVKSTGFMKKKNLKNKPVEEIREIELSVVPLTIPEDGDSLSSDILVIIKDSAGSGYFTSNINGRKSVIASNSAHSFIVTGSWEKGVFKTDVRATGRTLIEKREISRELYSLRPKFIEKAKLGHPVMFLKEEYTNGDIEKLTIHSIPLAIRKNKTDIVPTIYCMDNVSENKRVIYSAKDKDKILFEFEDEIYKVTSMWDGEYFESEITSMDS